MTGPKTILQDVDVHAQPGNSVLVVVRFEQVWTLSRGDDPGAALEEIRRLVGLHLNDGRADLKPIPGQVDLEGRVAT